jgi:hypothetical protein
MGDPNAGQKTYNGQVENLRQDARNFGGSVLGKYDTGATDLNTATGNMAGKLDAAIDPSQLGLSTEYQKNYNFGPQQQADLEADAARLPGLRLLPGRFMVIAQTIGLPAGRGELAERTLRAFVEQVKASGWVARALARHSIQGASVAPAA